ncbi:MAG: hypothetical protein HYY50_03975 [Candidatus Kerfeldbacteria bacterium]|nr:hypothetical protein [Candidatus Kerfeldbacteria bacterium]
MNKYPTYRQIIRFMEEAKHNGYDAEARSLKRKTRPGVDILQYPRGGRPRTRRWFWEDVWVGSNPFSGVTTVWYRARPCWQTHYWGYVVKSEDSEQVYKFLRWARRQRWQRKKASLIEGDASFAGLRYEVSEIALARAFSSIQKHEIIYRRRTLIAEVMEVKGICR